VLNLDHTVQPLRNLTGCKIVRMSIPETPAARGSGMMADAVAGEESLHVRICNLSFQAFDVEAGFRFVNARGALFFLDFKPGACHGERISKGTVVTWIREGCSDAVGRVVELPKGR
jgi:hypothetical protein